MKEVVSSSAYSERLVVSPLWWLLALGLAGLLAYEIDASMPRVPSWLPYVALAPLPLWAMWSLSRTRVEVVDGELRVGDAHVPVTLIGKAAAVPTSAKSAALGRQLDPAAYVQHRAWIGPMLLVVLNDPDDPTPYWLFSTRRPERLLAALGLSDGE